MGVKKFVRFFDWKSFKDSVTNFSTIEDFLTLAFLDYQERSGSFTPEQQAVVDKLNGGTAVVGLTKGQLKHVEQTTGWIYRKLRDWDCDQDWSHEHSNLEPHLLESAGGREVVPHK